MLPASVDPRAQTKITSLHPPPMARENSFSVRLVRLRSWRGASSRDAEAGMATGVADEAIARAKMESSFIAILKIAVKRNWV